MIITKYINTSLSNTKAKVFFPESIKVLFESDLGVVDFHPSAECAVIYISAAEMVEGSMYRKRLAGLKTVHKKNFICSHSFQ